MWSNPQETADFVTFTEEILNRKLHFLCIDPLGKYNYKRSQSFSMIKQDTPGVRGLLQILFEV